MIDKIYFIAVNFNNAHYTVAYINSVLKMEKALPYVCKVIIVDNKSKDSDVGILNDYIKEKENVTLLINPINSGYFKGLNKGLDSIKDKSNSLFIVGNNDLTFPADFIRQLTIQLYTTETLVLAPDVVTVKGIHQNPLCAERMSLIRKLGLRLYFSNYYVGKFIHAIVKKIKSVTQPNEKLQEARYIYMGIGACYILTEHFFSHFERLYELVFLWSEEAMLAGQITSVGGKMLYCPDIIVHHTESATVKNMPSKNTYRFAQQSFKICYKFY